MKCASCGGKLEGTMTFCPFCGVRAEVDLRQTHFRDLGRDESMACPECATALDIIQFDSSSLLQVERCGICHGIFFNPGELEARLDFQTNPLVWLDGVQLKQIATDFGHSHRVTYKKCPMCPERMSHLNFGGRSGVILDLCGVHGVWLEGSELCRLTEWWRAGGKLLFQQNEEEKARKLHDTKRTTAFLPDAPRGDRWNDPGAPIGASTIFDALISLASDFKWARAIR